MTTQGGTDGNADGDSSVEAPMAVVVDKDGPTAAATALDADPAPGAPAGASTTTASTGFVPEPSKILPGETGDQIFNRLILPEMEIMWRVALSLTRNAADAEDVVQEALLRAYRSIHTFDGRYPRAWVLTILRNTERNRHRRKRPELLSDPEIAEERGPATDPEAVEQYVEDREFDEAVAQALTKLPENFRQVIELVDIDGLAYQETADLLGVPLGTVMSRLHRARRRIRDLLIPLGYGPPSHSSSAASAQRNSGRTSSGITEDSQTQTTESRGEDQA